MMSAMNESRTRVRALGCLAFLALGLAACEGSDPVAPEGSTITVSANPQTVVVPSGQEGSTLITATLRASNGTRLPDEEIIFSTTAGRLDPPAQTPLTSDDDGQATSTLFTESAATVMASSGSITGTTQVQTAPGSLAQFVLNVMPTELFNCNDMLTLTALVVTTDGVPVQNLLVIFDEVPPSTVSGNFTPGSQVLTGPAGTATVTWTPSLNICARECQASTADPNDPTPGVCTLFFTANDTTDTFESVTQEIIDSIP